MKEFNEKSVEEQIIRALQKFEIEHINELKIVEVSFNRYKVFVDNECFGIFDTVCCNFVD